MTTALNTAKPDDKSDITTESLDAFLRDLDIASRRHGIALTDGSTLYMMEKSDYARSYQVSAASDLNFS